MPSKSRTADSGRSVCPGILYVVSTPIGNLDDITIRALRVLADVDLIAAEDTRHTRNLLAAYEIPTPLISCHEYNERERSADLVQWLKEGKSIALVSDAGTPLVSDPGHVIVRSAVDEGIPVVPVPGASAVLAALCVSGLPTDSFVFAGFPPRKGSSRGRWMDSLHQERRTIVLYESPRRVLALLRDLGERMGNRPAVLCRELTKMHEEILRGTVVDLIDAVAGREAIRGEITLIVAGCDLMPSEPADCLETVLRDMVTMQSGKLPDLAKEVTKRFGISRREAYERIRKSRPTSGRDTDRD